MYRMPIAWEVDLDGKGVTGAYHNEQEIQKIIQKASREALRVAAVEPPHYDFSLLPDRNNNSMNTHEK